MSPKRVLVTRTAPDNARSAEILVNRGFAPVLAPMLRIAPQADFDRSVLADCAALAFSSANGVRALGDCRSWRDLPVFAVGDATARAAQVAGFARVVSADGDVGALADLIARDWSPTRGAIGHIRGSDIAGDLTAALSQSGVEIKSILVYAAIAQNAFDPNVMVLFAAGEIEGALFHSPRAAKIFSELTIAAHLAPALTGIAAVALSPAVAGPISALPWRALGVAAQPREDALMAALCTLCL